MTPQTITAVFEAGTATGSGRAGSMMASSVIEDLSCFMRSMA